jgi:hypothetical protein
LLLIIMTTSRKEGRKRTRIRDERKHLEWRDEGITSINCITSSLIPYRESVEQTVVPPSVCLFMILKFSLPLDLLLWKYFLSLEEDPTMISLVRKGCEECRDSSSTSSI